MSPHTPPPTRTKTARSRRARDGASAPDWRGIAAGFLRRETRPAAVVGAGARILAVNGALERLVGRDAAELVGRRWAVALALSATNGAAAALGRALAMHETTLEMTVQTASGEHLALALEITPLTQRAATPALVVVASWKDASTAEALRGACDIVYDVSAADGVTLKRVWAHPAERRARGAIGSPCHAALHGQPRPCAGCPTIAAAQVRATRVGVIGERDHLELVAARKVEDDLVRVSVYPLDADHQLALHRAKIRVLAERAALTDREREVLELVLLGRSASEIGATLGISASTAKFHQANVLEKLGAESRFDLLRVFA